MSGTSDDRLYLDLARKTATASDCIRRQVGAVIVKDGTVLASAFNGTPDDCIPCNKGGCTRCQSDSPTGEAYDSCLCIELRSNSFSTRVHVGSHPPPSTASIGPVIPITVTSSPAASANRCCPWVPASRDGGHISPTSPTTYVGLGFR